MILNTQILYFWSVFDCVYAYICTIIDIFKCWVIKYSKSCFGNTLYIKFWRVWLLVRDMTPDRLSQRWNCPFLRTSYAYDYRRCKLTSKIGREFGTKDTTLLRFLGLQYTVPPPKYNFCLFKTANLENFHLRPLLEVVLSDKKPPAARCAEAKMYKIVVKSKIIDT